MKVWKFFVSLRIYNFVSTTFQDSKKEIFKNPENHQITLTDTKIECFVQFGIFQYLVTLVAPDNHKLICLLVYYLCWKVAETKIKCQSWTSIFR